MDQKDTLVDLFKRLGIACESTRKTSSFSFCCFCDFGREALHLLKLSFFSSFFNITFLTQEKETIPLPPPTSTPLFAAFVLLGAFASIKGRGSQF